MKRNPAWAGLLAAVLVLSACGSGGKVVVRDKAADEAAVRNVLAEIARTFDAGDYNGMLALYREDVIVSSTGNPDTVGREAWREGLKKLPPGVKLKLRFDTQEMEIAGDLAYERGKFVVSMPDPAGGEPQTVIDGRHIHIFKREADGSWKGWRLFEIQDKALLTPPAAPAEVHR